MEKYIVAAANAGVIDLRKEARLVPYRTKVDAFFKSTKDLSKYLLVDDGPSGRAESVLSRTIGKGLLRLGPDDIVIFLEHDDPCGHLHGESRQVEDTLRSMHVRIFTDVHVSGHGAKEDMRDVIKMMQPEHLIPTHGEMKQLGALKDMAVNDLGYVPAKVHILSQRPEGEARVSGKIRKDVRDCALPHSTRTLRSGTRSATTMSKTRCCACSSRSRRRSLDARIRKGMRVFDADDGQGQAHAALR